MKLKLLQLLLVSLSYCPIVYSRPENDSLLNELNKTINNTKLYDDKKREDIASIKNSFNDSKDSPLPLRYEFYRKLYEEYKYFRFDTAYIYALKMQQTAFALADPSRISESNINLFFVLVSAGMFNEASDLIRKINITDQADGTKANYFSLKARYYFDLADYVHDEFHSPRYNQNGKDNLDSALSLFPVNSFESLYFRGLKNLKNDSFARAFDDFQTLLKRSELSNHEVALVTSTLSYIYRMRGDKNNAIRYQMRAAISDIKSSTKETYAILNLSKLLFEQGDFKNASFFIEKAIDDATFYGARQRKVQVSAIMPIIQSSRINLIEGQRQSLIIYGFSVSGVLILLTFLIIVIYRQNQKLKHAKKLISDAHLNLHEINTKLQEVNSKLTEANKIKEEYIGYFFTINSGILRKIERLKTSIEQKVSDRK